jgi:hypothetical protein
MPVLRADRFAAFRSLSAAGIELRVASLTAFDRRWYFALRKRAFINNFAPAASAHRWVNTDD